MKTLKWISLLLLAGVIAIAGCGKPKVQSPVIDGTTIDMPKLREAFATAPPEINSTMAEINVGVRYRDYPRALTGLDKLANAPGLTDAQKKIVGVVTEQVKTVASKAGAPRTP
jgi:hypothetical protein